ncbi:hypothetical protein [Halobacillus sp. A5]|nr:hypothetical protein [Halobacillus sp. A5]
MVVDSCPYSWDEIGRMLFTHEGFQIKIDTAELTEDIGGGKE